MTISFLQEFPQRQFIAAATLILGHERLATLGSAAFLDHPDLNYYALQTLLSRRE
jgi:hypothetical protein